MRLGSPDLLTTETLEVHHTAAGAPVHADDFDEEKGHEVLTFKMRRLTAGESQSIVSTVQKTGRRKSKDGAMRALEASVIASVQSVTGLEDAGGAAVTKLTPELYRQLPTWVTVRLINFMTDMNGLTEDDEGN